MSSSTRHQSRAGTSRRPATLEGAGAAIYRLLQNSGFQPEHAEAMGQAFEHTLATLGLKDRADPLVELIAKKIIEIGQQGERDPQRMRDLAIKAFTT